jgi:hypothetical protein
MRSLQLILKRAASENGWGDWGASSNDQKRSETSLATARAPPYESQACSIYTLHEVSPCI